MRPDTSKVDPRFLLYYYLGPDFQQVIQARKIQGSTVNRIPLTELPSYPIYLPPLPEQRAIAAILGSLDDKIELNRQMNATLEAIACAIFKSWFVDFDSVHAKARGEAPAGMDAATAALFPDGFVESELGPIPAGWEAGKLKQLVKMKNGKRPGKREREQTSELQIPLYGGGGVMGYVEESLYTEPILLTGRVGTLGNVFRVTEPCWPSDNTITIRPRREILYFVLRHVRFSVLNRGSTQPLIAQKDLKLLPVVIPSNEELRTYHQFARSLFKKVDLNKTESRALAELRDTLLPKLISGELRVPEKMRQD
jgi:type I restriction enzyme S subunit